MLKFNEFMLLKEGYITRDAAEDIVFNALNIDDEAKEEAFDAPLESFGDLKNAIIDNNEIKMLPNFEQIKTLVELEADKTTVGDLITILSEK